MFRRQLRHRLSTEWHHFRSFVSRRAAKIALLSVGVMLVVIVAAANIRLAFAGFGSPFFYIHLAAVYVLDRERMLWYTSRVGVVTAGLLAAVGVRYVISPPATTANAPLTILLGVAVLVLLSALMAYVVYLLRFGFGERPAPPSEWWRRKLHVDKIRQLVRTVRGTDDDR